MSINIELLLILALLMQAITIYKIIHYKKTIDKKNMQLLQFHLESKFLHKGLVNSLKCSDSRKLCRNLMQQIKEYYNLEEIIIVDSVKMMGEDRNFTKGAVINFLRQDIEPMIRMLKSHELKKFNLDIGKQTYVLYISRLAIVDGSDGVIICIENAPSLLTPTEQKGLENSINLLKNRLLYD